MRDLLRKSGYVVVRAAGSRGPVDLVALKADQDTLLVQCKRDGRMPDAERAEILTAAALAGGTPILAYRDGQCIALRLVTEKTP